jgi:hypothetical protein
MRFLVSNALSPTSCVLCPRSKTRRQKTNKQGSQVQAWFNRHRNRPLVELLNYLRDVPPLWEKMAAGQLGITRQTKMENLYSRKRNRRGRFSKPVAALPGEFPSTDRTPGRSCRSPRVSEAPLRLRGGHRVPSIQRTRRGGAAHDRESQR